MTVVLIRNTGRLHHNPAITIKCSRNKAIMGHNKEAIMGHNKEAITVLHTQICTTNNRRQEVTMARAGQEVRPRRPSEREEQVRAFPLILVMAIGSTDDEARLALAAVAPALELFRKLHRREGLAALVENDRDRIG